MNVRISWLGFCHCLHISTWNLWPVCPGLKDQNACWGVVVGKLCWARHLHCQSRRLSEAQTSAWSKLVRLYSRSCAESTRLLHVPKSCSFKQVPFNCDGILQGQEVKMWMNSVRIRTANHLWWCNSSWRHGCFDTRACACEEWALTKWVGFHTLLNNGIPRELGTPAIKLMLRVALLEHYIYNR